MYSDLCYECGVYPLNAYIMNRVVSNTGKKYCSSNSNT